MRAHQVALVLVIITASAAARTNHEHASVPVAQGSVTAARSAASDYRTRVAADLQEAAKRVGVRVDGSKLMVATRDDAFLAIAPAYDQKDVFLYMQASFSGESCAAVLPDGYYSVRIVPVSKGNPTKAQFINAD